MLHIETKVQYHQNFTLRFVRFLLSAFCLSLSLSRKLDSRRESEKSTSKSKRLKSGLARQGRGVKD
ncbi:MAG: hypothetical protein ACJASL_000007 [Paraglaciecola sp.]|jgi:hypothetical protein